MTDDRLPLLRGRISATHTYQSPQQRLLKLALPSRDPSQHSARLREQLDAISQFVEARPSTARDELASRELIAVQPAAEAALQPSQLGNARADARLVGVLPETKAVLLDVARADLTYLRKKVDEFADDAKVDVKTKDDGTVTRTRKHEKAISPIDEIRLANLDDIGYGLRAQALALDRMYWFEVACRGGYRNPPSETVGSRAQISRQLHKLDAFQNLDEFQAPEQVYFSLRLTLAQLEALRAATDCIYEIALAPPSLRDLKLLDDTSTRELQSFELLPPPDDAPAVVLLDTGIATEHPLLKSAILSATTAAAVIPSPEDTYGHGTRMAGVALHNDLGSAIERGYAQATHWLQSSRLLVAPQVGTASDDNYHNWPVLTLGAVHAAEHADARKERQRAYLMAVTRSMQVPPFDELVPTLWSHAIDQIAFGEARERLVIVSAGNAREERLLTLADLYPQLQLSEKIHQPAQAANSLTVGAFTERTAIPNMTEYAEASVVARIPKGISPFTSTGLSGSNWPIKPDVVLEGGNLAVSGSLTVNDVPTLCALTTSHQCHRGYPLGLLSMTSEASARAARLAAQVWTAEPTLRPQSVRGLIVHSASWTQTMREQFAGRDDLLMACGYGVPDESLASRCAKNVATVIIEDRMPNGVREEVPKRKAPKRATTSRTESKIRRKVKLYRLPTPEGLLSDSDPEVELRVTLSYFAEPNKFGLSVFHGLDLKWDMQGPGENEDMFLQRINALRRPPGPTGKPEKAHNTKSFAWDIGIQRRSRGTVQSDRWRGRMSHLVGDKLIAVLPVLGWWDQRKQLKTEEMHFSLIVSVIGPGVYAAIQPRVEAAAVATVDLAVEV